MVLACVALFVALGGTGYAAVKLPKKSVGAKQLRSRAVTPPKLAPATVARAKGDKGDAGESGVAGVRTRERTSPIQMNCAVITPTFHICNGGGVVRADCEPGERALSGHLVSGAQTVTTSAGPQPTAGEPTAWEFAISVAKNSDTPISSTPVTARVTCAG